MILMGVALLRRNKNKIDPRGAEKHVYAISALIANIVRTKRRARRTKS